MINEDFNAYLFAFGEDVTWFNGIDRVVIKGIYSARYAEEKDGEYLIETREVVFGFIENDVVGVAVGDELFRGNDTYTVISKQPDGLGWTEIIVERA